MHKFKTLAVASLLLCCTGIAGAAAQTESSGAVCGPYVVEKPTDIISGTVEYLACVARGLLSP